MKASLEFKAHLETIKIDELIEMTRRTGNAENYIMYVKKTIDLKEFASRVGLKDDFEEYIKLFLKYLEEESNDKALHLMAEFESYLLEKICCPSSL